MIRRAGCLPQERLEVAVADHAGAWAEFSRVELLPGGLADQPLSGQPYAIDHVGQVLVGLVMIEDGQRRV